MKHPLIQLEAVDVELGGRLVLRDLNWSLRPGQHWMVLGRNGSGKSTFLRLLRGELWPVAGGNGRRIYCLDGEPQFTAVGVRERLAHVSPEQQSRYLFQEWSLRVDQVIASGVDGGDYVYRALTQVEQERVAAVANTMKIAHLHRRNVQELSTGELRRVLIARALAGQPQVLICDEIGDGLDRVSRATLIEALEGVAGQGTQLLLSTHRADEIPRSMTHRILFEEGRIAVQGRIEAGASLTSPAGLGRREFDRCFTKAEQKRLSRQQGKAGRSGQGGEQKDSSDEVLIQIRGADVYLGTTPTLQDIQLEIRRGQHWAILGPNGSGKTTLMKLIAGDVHPAWGGRVRRFAFTRKNTLWQLRALLGYVSPELQSNYREPISGLDVVTSGFFSSVGLVEKPSTAQRRQVREVLARLGLSDLVAKNFLEMSYGEARRILLARALVKRPALLLLDEPFDGLDVLARSEMRRAMMEATTLGATLVVITHHADDLPECITHVVQMEGGRIKSSGPYQNC